MMLSRKEEKRLKREEKLKKQRLRMILKDRELQDKYRLSVPSRELRPMEMRYGELLRKLKMSLGVDNGFLEKAKQVIIDAYKANHCALTPIDVQKGHSEHHFLFKIHGQSNGFSKLLSHRDDLEMLLQRRNIKLELVPEQCGLRVSVPKAAPGEASPQDSVVSLYESIDLVRSSDKYLPIYFGEEDCRPEGNSGKRNRKIVMDLYELPHMLVAGATGSGKTVFLHTLLHSLFAAKPHHDPTYFSLIDLKGNELPSYANYDPVKGFDGLKHSDLATTPEEALYLLADNVSKMEYRCRVMRDNNADQPPEATVSNWYEYMDLLYNLGWLYSKKKKRRAPRFHGPRVVVIDEWADLYLGTKGKMREAILNCVVRLAQKGRAAGIHVVLATQTPRTDVIPGMVKVNFPARMCFRVPTAIDSRVVLDTGGAEKLYTPGSALFKSPAYSDLLKIQTPLPV